MIFLHRKVAFCSIGRGRGKSMWFCHRVEYSQACKGRRRKQTLIGFFQDVASWLLMWYAIYTGLNIDLELISEPSAKNKQSTHTHLHNLPRVLLGWANWPAFATLILIFAGQRLAFRCLSVPLLQTYEIYTLLIHDQQPSKANGNKACLTKG